MTDQKTDDAKGASGTQDVRLTRSGKCLRIAFCCVLLAALGEATLRVTGYEKIGRANPELYIADAAVGYRMRANADVTSHGCRVITNRSGLRGEHWGAAQANGTGAVLFSGHSIAFGFGLRTGQSYPEIVAELSGRDGGERFVSVNCGHCAMRFDQELPIVMELLGEVQPVAIHVLMTGNDFEPRWNPFIHADGAENAEAGRLPIPGKRWLRGHSVLYKFLRKRWSRVLRATGLREIAASPVYERLGGDSATTQGEWSAYEESLAALVEAAGVPVAFSVFPMGHTPETIARARAMAERVGLTWIAIDDLWEDQADYLRRGTLTWDSHPNAAAQRAMAERIHAGMAPLLRRPLRSPPETPTESK